MMNERMKELIKRSCELFNSLLEDCIRYEYLDGKKRAELREKYELLKIHATCHNSKIPKEFHEHCKKYKLLQFIYYDIPREIDVSRLRLWKE